MNQPKYTAAPIVCEPESPFSLKSLFMGHRRSTRYYEAADSGGTLYLLWMEYSRFGVLMAYPCALSEAGGESLFFDTSSDPAPSSEPAPSEVVPSDPAPSQAAPETSCGNKA